MFPNPRKLHDPLRPILIPHPRVRDRHLLRFDKEMRRRDIVISTIRRVWDFQERIFAIAGVRVAVDIGVADGVGGGDAKKGESEEGEVEMEGGGGGGEEVHGDGST